MYNTGVRTVRQCVDMYTPVVTQSLCVCVCCKTPWLHDWWLNSSFTDCSCWSICRLAKWIKVSIINENKKYLKLPSFREPLSPRVTLNMWLLKHRSDCSDSLCLTQSVVEHGASRPTFFRMGLAGQAKKVSQIQSLLFRGIPEGNLLYMLLVVGKQNTPSYLGIEPRICGILLPTNLTLDSNRKGIGSAK